MVALLLAMAAACGEEPEGPAPPRFPVRQLESGDLRPSDGRLVLDESFDSLEDWWLLSVKPDFTCTIEPAQGAAGIGQQDGHIVLKPDTALVRHVLLPERSRYTLSSLLWGQPAPARSPCPNLILASTKTLKDWSAATGSFATPGAANALATVVAASVADPVKATWREDAGGGFTEARSYTDVYMLPGETRGYLVVIAAWGQPLIVDNVTLLSTPVLRHGYDPSTELPSDRADVTVRGVKIAGQYRISARVPAGKTLSVPINVPEGAVDIALGTCADPDPAVPPDTTTSWSLVLQPGNIIVGQFDDSTPPAGEIAQFNDQIIPWPADVQGPVTMELSVTGDAAMVFGQPKVRGPESADAPSILFISIDTLRADHLGFMGYDRPTSPFLDELAARSAVFTDLVAAASYTLPTHATMFTGLFPPHHLAIDTLDRVDATRTPTLGKILSEVGYHTAGFTGGGFVSVDYGFAAGFDRYTTIDPVAVPKILAPDAKGVLPDKQRIAQARQASGNMADSIGRWIMRQGQRRWMAFIHTFAVHEYDPPKEDELLFRRPHDLPADFDAQRTLNTSDPVTNPPSDAARARIIDLYDATIHHVDRRLRELFEMLDKRGLLDNTIIVVTSDHGEEFFDHGHFRHRGTLYQDLIHVPLIIHVPGAKEGVRVTDPVTQADLLPTLLELLGEPVPEGLDGRSLATYVRGSHPSAGPTPLFSHIDRYLHGRTSLREGPLKIIHSDTSSAREEPATVEWELYDLQRDPDERTNLAAEHPEELDALRRRLDAFEASLRGGSGQRQSIEMNDELREQLIGLGYVEAAR